MFVISNRKAIHCLALLFLSPLLSRPVCELASCRLGVYNEFQWQRRLVLSEEQAGSLQRPDDKQTLPPDCNRTERRRSSFRQQMIPTPSPLLLSLFSQFVVTLLLSSTPSPFSPFFPFPPFPSSTSMFRLQD